MCLCVCVVSFLSFLLSLPLKAQIHMELLPRGNYSHQQGTRNTAGLKVTNDHAVGGMGMPAQAKDQGEPKLSLHA